MRVPLSHAAKNGPGWIRTSDLGIKSPLLYQLSYRPATASVATGRQLSLPRLAPID